MSQLQLQLQQSTMASLVSARLTHSVSPQITGKQIPGTEFHLSVLQQLSTSRELQGNIVPATSQIPTAGLDNQGPEAHLTHPVLAGRALCRGQQFSHVSAAVELVLTVWRWPGPRVRRDSGAGSCREPRGARSLCAPCDVFLHFSSFLTSLLPRKRKQH